MPTISIAAIVKNERINIVDFLKTIELLADELVIVDTGSTDGTVDLIKNAKTPYPVRLYEKKFEPFHFGKAINAAIDPCLMDYVFFLEADHRLGPGFEQTREFLAEKKPDAVEVRLVDDLVPHLKVYRTRLFKKGIRYFEDEKSTVDPVLTFTGKAVPFEALLFHLEGGEHRTRRKLSNRNRMRLQVQNSVRTRPRWRELARGITAFYYIFRKNYIRMEAYKDGLYGFRYAFEKAWTEFMYYFYLSLKPRQSVV